MKKIIFQLLVCLMVSTVAQAQAPQTINYQAVVRNTAGDVIKNQSVRFRLSITEGLNGFVVYSETHQATTNLLGLVNLNIGSGSIVSGSMLTLNWAGVSKYLKVEVDVAGGTNFVVMGSQQLVSVPYALHANTAGSVANQWQFNTNGIHYNLGKVGIGTAAPEAKLSLIGDETGVTPDGVPDPRRFLYVKNNSTGQFSTVFQQFQAGSSNTNTTFGHHASTYYHTDFADFGQIWSTGKGLILRASPPTANDANNGIIKFMTGYNAAGGSNERMRITNDGKIGIGTAAPDAKVTIQGEGDGLNNIENRNFLTLKNTSTSNASSTNMFLYAGNSNNFTVLNHNSSTYNILNGYADCGVLASTGAGLVLRANAGVLRFETGMNNALHLERMRITNEGNIGIGTILPKRKLELVYNSDGSGIEDGRFAFKIHNMSTSNASQGGLVINAGGGTNETTLSHVAPSYSIYSGYSDFGQLRSTGPGLVLQAPNSFGIIKFQTGGITERMRIEANGNVGIGTELPKSKLEVKEGDVYVNDPTKGIILKSPNGNCWRVTIDNTGNFVRTAITCPN